MVYNPLIMQKSTLLYSYSGLINPVIKRKIIMDFRVAVKEDIQSVDKQKKSVYILQEAISNVLNYYTDINFTETKNTSAHCTSFIDNETIKLEFVSVILNNDIPSLEKKINNLNCIRFENLKEELALNLNKPISNDRGANIGLITILLKSNNKLKYEFTKIDTFTSKFTLTVLIQ